MYLDNIDILFSIMFREDKEYTKYKSLAVKLLPDLQESYEAKVGVLIAELRYFVSKHAESRKNEVEMFENCLQEAKKKTDLECVEMIKQFSKKEKEILISGITSKTKGEDVGDRMFEESHNVGLNKERKKQRKKLIDDLYNGLMEMEIIQTEQ